MAAAPVQLKFEASHNTCALQDDTLPEAALYLEMIQFLRRSRIHYAITADTPIYHPLTDQFWNTAFHATPPSIRAIVAGHQIVITEDSIRDVLQFGDVAEDRVEFHLFFYQRLFWKNGNYTRWTSPQYGLFLRTCWFVCLSSRKGGFDGIGSSLQSVMVALVLKKQFNFSRYVFLAMKVNTMASTIPQKNI